VLERLVDQVFRLAAFLDRAAGQLQARSCARVAAAPRRAGAFDPAASLVRGDYPGA
jgi:hypothetical protein